MHREIQNENDLWNLYDKNGKAKAVGNDPNNSDISKLLLKALQNKNSDSRQIKLPPLSLPNFYGDAKGCRIFKNYARILMAQAISQTRKLLALQNACKSQAYDLIKNVMIVGDSDNSADKAWRILQRRFNCDKALVATEVETLFNIQKHQNRLENIKILNDKANSVIQNLKGIINEREELQFVDEERPRKIFTALEMKGRLADIFFSHSITRNFDMYVDFH